MACIYKITNTVNNKVYIGQTRQKLATRWNQHKTCSKSYCYPLYAAMRKYGVENFTCECLQECTVEELDALEIYWMDHFNAYKKGYNAKAGGSANYEGIMINGNQLHKKKVKQYTLDGKFIKEYDGINEAARKTDININRIIACCKHRQHQTSGFLWCYTGEEDTIAPKQARVEYDSIRVVAIKGDEVLHFDSIREASRATGGIRKTIAEHCKNNKPYKGYEWKYEN